MTPVELNNICTEFSSKDILFLNIVSCTGQSQGVGSSCLCYLFFAVPPRLASNPKGTGNSLLLNYGVGTGAEQAFHISRIS